MYKTRAIRDKKGKIIHEVGAPPPGVRDGCCCRRCQDCSRRFLFGWVSAHTPAADPHPQQSSSHPLLSQDLQSKDLPTTRIQPDRRWFGNTRVIGQKQLEQFRDEMASKVNDSYTVLLREKKLPLQLLEDPERKVRGAAAGCGQGEHQWQRRRRACAREWDTRKRGKKVAEAACVPRREA
jgi:hypothetical protein